MKISAKTFLTDDSGIPFMGPGPVRLLEKIDEYKSINKAAKSMSLSYVKALNILNRLERCLGEKMFVRKRGGSEHGGTCLTPYAERYIISFRGLEKKIDDYARAEFQEFKR
ncbi:MAG: LysR family transcriptional regulator, partial [Deltaproteobacteria bacterium]|nr:LysR family transcriptional regulator [Deltaproteobacteria bacterium]